MNETHTPEVGEVTDKVGYSRRWSVGKKTVQHWLGDGMPHVRFGHRSVRIHVAQADAWLLQRYGMRRKAKTAADKTITTLAE
jgi:hypothetical protein